MTAPRRPPRLAAPLLAAALLVAAPARAEDAPPAPGRTWIFLPGAPRAIDDDRSASRDAAVIEYAYGPRAQLSLGHDLGLVERRGDVSLHLSLAALVALEDSVSHGPLPDEVGRILVVLAGTVAYDHWGRSRLGRDGTVELGVALGAERARALLAAETDRPVPAPRPGDIPFGGGGTWLAFDAALRVRLAPRLTLTARLRERVFLSALPLLVGARAASDLVADDLADGLAHAPSLDVRLAWELRPRVRPFISAFAEGLFPQDETAHASWFVRGLAGLAVRGAAGELMPFVSLDAGSGKGLLVNRHEVRLSVGVRHAF